LQRKLRKRAPEDPPMPIVDDSDDGLDD